MNKKFVRFFIRKLLIIIVLLLVSSHSNLYAGEDVLRLLVWEGYTPEKYVKEFEKDIARNYGRKVHLEVTFAGSHNDFFDSIRNKNVDLVIISHHTIKDERFNFIDKGLILPFNLDNIPNHKNIISELQLAPFYRSKGLIYGVPVASGPYGLAYNTKKFKQAPNSWKVFWEPAFKNKYVIGAHEYIYNVNITAMAHGYPRESISSFDALNNRKFREKLRQFALNANALWVGVDKPDDFIGMSIATLWGFSLPALKRRGEIWEMAAPEEGTIWWVDVYAMTLALKNNPFLKKVAEEWINKSLSSKFQVNHLIRELGSYPVIKNIEDKLTTKEKERVQISEPGSFMEKHILQSTYSQRDRNGLQVLWEEATKGISINE